MKFYHKLLPKKLIEILYKMKMKIYYMFYVYLYALNKKYIKVRSGTTDIDVFKEIFIKCELKIQEKINPKLIIDCGAYVGFSSLYLSKKYPSSIIYAIEPELKNYNSLLSNCRDTNNIKPINAGIWNSSTELDIEIGLGEWNFITKELEFASLNSVRGITINELLQISGLDIIDVLKVDIEGSEYQMFDENCHIWLSKVKLIFIELHETMLPGSSKTFYEAISRYEWKEYKSGEKLVLIRQ